MTAETCARCRQRPSELTRGTEPLCGSCWSLWRAELVQALGGHDRIEREAEGYVSTWVPLGGVQVGAHRPDHGADQFEVACPLCEASWVGAIGSVCAWCARREAEVIAEHRRALLDGPMEHETMREWAHRLADAVKAGVVEMAVARAAWDRRCRRAA
ncbi:MAG: hypothetical protein R2715_15115 [Ilumatobacteraceae bacterium]